MALRIALAYARPVNDDALFTALVIGAFLASVPSLLVAWKPGTAPTRHAIAVAQMLYGALLVHLTRGAASAEVHLLFSLALVALYRDPLVVVTGTAVGVLQVFTLFDVPVGSVHTAAILRRSCTASKSTPTPREGAAALILGPRCR